MAQLDVALVVLRVVFGVFMVLHGANKVRGGLDGVASWFGGIGMRHPRWQARAAAGTEIGAGALFALGLLTPFAAAGLVGVMVVAAWVAHRKIGFFVFHDGQGWEYTAAIATVAFAVGTVGPGRWSIDHALGIGWDAWSGWIGAVISGGLGLLSAVVLLLATYRPESSA